MKKSTVLFSACLVLIEIIGCKKDWMCSCHTTYSNSLPPSNTAFSIMNQTKKMAENVCNGQDIILTTNGVTTTKNCELE